MSRDTGAPLPALSQLMASSFASGFGLKSLGTGGWHLPWPRGRSPVEHRGPRGAQGGCGVQFAVGHGTGHRDGRLEVAAAIGVDIGCSLHPGELLWRKRRIRYSPAQRGQPQPLGCTRPWSLFLLAIGAQCPHPGRRPLHPRVRTHIVSPDRDSQDRGICYVLP